MRLSLGYPSRQAERILLQQDSRQALISTIEHVFSQQDILNLQQLARNIYLSDVVLDYILDLAEMTRKGRHGLSTRGILALKATQAYALLEKRSYATTDDVQAVFNAVVSHRLGTTDAESYKLLQSVAVS